MGSRTISRSACCTLTAAVLLAGALVAPVAALAASAPSCGVGGLGDLDGNGKADLIVGAPSSDAVDVRYDGSPDKLQRLRGSDFDPSIGGNGRFGASTSVATDSHQCSLLVIGAPYYGSPVTAGRVFIAPVVNGKVTTTGAITLTPGPSAHRFGSAVAAFGNDIWVGAPSATASGVRRAGAVYHYRLTDDGSAQLIGRYTEKSPGIPGGPEKDDRFGSVLSMDDAGAVAVGEPSEDVGQTPNAGTVTIIRTDASRVDPGTGAFTSATTISQNTPGVGGVAEADDGFGTSLSMIETGYPDTSVPDVLAVGTPGEGIGEASRTGTVQVFDLQPGHLSQAGGYTQNSPGVPGGNESGDGFGRSVQFGSFTGGLVDGIRALDLAIGVPYEDRGVGRVVVQRGVKGYPSSNAPVKATAGSLTGRSLGTVPLSDSGGSRLAVARPGDDFGDPDVYARVGSLVLLDDHSPTTTVTFNDSAGLQKFGEYGVPANLIATQTITVR